MPILTANVHVIRWTCILSYTCIIICVMKGLVPNASADSLDGWSQHDLCTMIIMIVIFLQLCLYCTYQGMLCSDNFVSCIVDQYKTEFCLRILFADESHLDAWTVQQG